MHIQSIKETCIYVRDLHRTKDFYSDILGLPVIAFADGRHLFFRAGSSVLLCFLAEATLQEKELPPHGASGIMHFAFQVNKEDYEAALAQVRSAGILILHEHLWKHGIRSFYFHDPDQHLVEVVEAGLWD